MMIYLIAPELFNELSEVNGFNDRNGATYAEYLIQNICSYDHIPEEMKTMVQDMDDPDKILDLLNNNDIKYSHNYHQVQSNKYNV